MSRAPEPSVVARPAQMARAIDGLSWAVYVVLYGETVWPEVRLAIADGIPTRATRDAALARLGYAVAAPDEPWQWDEAEDPGDPYGRGAVHVFATTTVVPLASGGAQHT
jgi:Family of unknown function (DUF6303)